MKRRFVNISIVIFSTLYSLLRGSARKSIHPKSFVVVYGTNNIGDMVCVTPVFCAIKEHNPQSHITVLCSKKSMELLAHNADIDECVDIAQPVTSLIRILRKKNIDAGVAINLDAIELGMLFLGNVQSISCYSLTSSFRGYEARPYRVVSKYAHCVEYFPGKYIPEQHLKLLTPFGIHSNDATKHLAFSKETSAEISTKLAEQHIHDSERVIAIAPGAGSDLKRWPAHRFAEVANHLYKKFNTPIIIVGGTSDVRAINEMVSALDVNVRYWCPGAQSMNELKATLARAVLVIGNDSGAIHVAEAVGAKTITIAGATDVDEHMRESNGHCIVRGEGEGIKYQSYIGDESKMDPQLARAQMESIPVSIVLQEFCGLIT